VLLTVKVAADRADWRQHRERTAKQNRVRMAAERRRIQDNLEEILIRFLAVWRYCEDSQLVLSVRWMAKFGQ
jgi:hypothetical protein